MGTNVRNRIPKDDRAPRRDSARLEADYRREVRKAAEERVRMRLAAEDRMYPLGQEATQSRYREDYRERNRSTGDTYARRRNAGQQSRNPRQAADRDRTQRSERVSYGDEIARPRSRQGAPRDVRDDRMRERRQQRTQYERDGRRSDLENRTPYSSRDSRVSGRRDYATRDDRRERDMRSGDPQRRQQRGRDMRTADSQHRQQREREALSQERMPQARSSMFSPRVIIGVISLVGVLILATFAVRIATSLTPTETEDTLVPMEEQVSDRVKAYKLSESEIVDRFEDQGVEETWAVKAAAMAQEDYRFMAMAHGSETLGSDGPAVANKLVKLAVSDTQAIDYVYDYLTDYPQDSAQPCDDKITKGVVPNLYQWDERWGYITYSGCSFGCTGCGPTSLSMVYMGLTGDNSKSPADMAQLASDNGYETEYEGTMNQFFISGAAEIGLNVMEIDINSDALTAVLEDGMPVICNVGPGDFTTNGHFFVITGLNDDGTVNINDPFSSVNSSEPWDMDLVLGQTVALYAYSLNEDSDSESDDESSTEQSAQADAGYNDDSYDMYA